MSRMLIDKSAIAQKTESLAKWMRTDWTRRNRFEIWSLYSKTGIRMSLSFLVFSPTFGDWICVVRYYSNLKHGLWKVINNPSMKILANVLNRGGISSTFYSSWANPVPSKSISWTLLNSSLFAFFPIHSKFPPQPQPTLLYRARPAIPTSKVLLGFSACTPRQA